ncbi:MAG: SIMPL domain-containing protein [Candidatus Paceibacterota bacterium]|jgi:hypothetical protein
MEKKFYQTKIFTSLMIAILALLIVGVCFGITVIVNVLTSSHRVGQDISKVPTITVSGTGEVYTKADMGLVVLSVVTESKTVSQAMTENASKMNNVISFVKQQGVEEKDLKTTNFSINPVYAYNNDTGKRTLTGYQINQSLQVKVRDLSKIGTIIEGATNLGANEVGSLQFVIDDDDAVKAQAREEAIKDAKSKAEILAKQLGVKLVRVTGFNESGIYPTQYYYGAEKLSSSIGMGGGIAPDIQTGENKTSITVSVTYEIK